ncbi:MAG: response regulator [Gammaproteobacteria bacterium]|nr:response regulator [Gammaproteobacteria bacterium]
MRIAIVEDEQKLAQVLKDYLSKENFQSDIYPDGKEALEKLIDSPPDLVLLDLMLPSLDGMSLCKEFRTVSDVPVIMLTARVEEIDRLLGLEIGADDYICKPYSPREVVARVKAVLRRTHATQSPEILDEFSLDENTARVTIKGDSCDLTAVELKLLKAMVDSPGRIFNRTQLMNRIYNDNRIVSDRTIDSHVKKLRQKLKSLNSGVEYVHSVYGIGYKFEADTNS